MIICPGDICVTWNQKKRTFSCGCKADLDDLGEQNVDLLSPEFQLGSSVLALNVAGRDRNE